MSDLTNDIKYAFRQLRKHPGFTAVVVLTLALGIGANTAIFSLVDTLLIRTIPVAHPEQIHALSPGQIDSLNHITFEYLRNHSVEADVFAFRKLSLRIQAEGQTHVGTGQLVSGNYFSSLGMRPALGRTLTVDDDRDEAVPVALISHGYWLRHFGGTSDVLGRTLQLNDLSFSVVGVTTKGFYGLDTSDPPEVYVPIHTQPRLEPSNANMLNEFGSWSFRVLARLHPGIARQQVALSMTQSFQQVLDDRGADSMREEDRQNIPNQKMALLPAARGISPLREQFTRPLSILMIAVGGVLLIACGNVANLFLVRATTRQRETAVRVALGADRVTLFRVLLTESLLFALLGGLVAILLAFWSLNALAAFLPDGMARTVLEHGLDIRVLVFTALLSLLSALFFGMAPALQGMRLNVIPALKKDAGIDPPGRASRLRLAPSLVILQITLSLILMIGTGLVVRSLLRLKGIDAGFDRDNLLLVTIRPGVSGLNDADQDALETRLRDPGLLRQLSELPGIRSASVSSANPIDKPSWWRVPVKVLGASYNTGADSKGTYMTTISPGYFRTTGIQVLQGRALSELDRSDSQRVAVVNEAWVRRYLGGDREAVGAQFEFSGVGIPGTFTVVARVEDSKAHGLRSESAPMIYLPYTQFPMMGRYVFALRTAGRPAQLMPVVRRLLEGVDRHIAIDTVTTLDGLIDDSLVRERAVAWLAGGFSLLALLLSVIGLYGVLTHQVARRTHEIGLRLAIGAQASDVVRFVLRKGMCWALMGIVLGLAGAAGLSRSLEFLLYGISPTDPATFMGLALILGLTAFFATWIPARRAARVDPMAALRYE